MTANESIAVSNRKSRNDCHWRACAPGWRLYRFLHGIVPVHKKNYPDKQVCVYVEEIPDAFDYLKEEDAFMKSLPMTCLFPLTAEMRSVLVMHKR